MKDSKDMSIKDTLEAYYRLEEDFEVYKYLMRAFAETPPGIEREAAIHEFQERFDSLLKQDTKDDNSSFAHKGTKVEA